MTPQEDCIAVLPEHPDYTQLPKIFDERHASGCGALVIGWPKPAARGRTDPIGSTLVYLLFLDESGTHGGSPAFVLGGVAVHEVDAWYLSRKLETFLHNRLTPLGLNALQHELHATEIKNGKREWKTVPAGVRFGVLTGGYTTIAQYRPKDPAFPMALFGAVIESRDKNRERRAYELVLKKFDDMLRRINERTGTQQRGLVIHDKRVVDRAVMAHNYERSIQEWTAGWREAAETIGRLLHFAEVPLFADSKATRLIQAADFVAFALWRYYGMNDGRYASQLWSCFDRDGDAMHGLIHVTHRYAKGLCQCPPCDARPRLGGTP